MPPGSLVPDATEYFHESIISSSQYFLDNTLQKNATFLGLILIAVKMMF